jgi:hypothetical protein
VKAVRKGNFTGWSMLTVENSNKYFTEIEEAMKGHMEHYN